MAANKVIIVNELLAFIQNAIDSMDEISIMQICKSNFKEEDICSGKALLFQSTGKTAQMPSRRRAGGERSVQDTITLLKQTDPDDVPDFVTKELYKLPPVGFDHVDVTRLLRDIAFLKSSLADVLTKLEASDKTIGGLQAELLLLRSSNSVSRSPNVASNNVNAHRSAHANASVCSFESAEFDSPECPVAVACVSNMSTRPVAPAAASSPVKTPTTFTLPAPRLHDYDTLRYGYKTPFAKLRLIMLLTVCVCASIYYVTYGQYAARIVGGETADISDYPHSASLRTVDPGVKYLYWGCTSSIITQQLILTAAHCTPSSDQGTCIVSVGHNDVQSPTLHRALSFLRHKEYGKGGNDVALIKLKIPLTLSSVVSRVALVPKPPYRERAYVAGWGLVSNEPRINGTVLKAVVQYVRSDKYCNAVMDSNSFGFIEYEMPSGTICASSGTESDHPSHGDSGAALVVRGYIQLGLASFYMQFAPYVMFYTDTGFYYEWITQSAKEMMCDSRCKVVNSDKVRL